MMQRMNRKRSLLIFGALLIWHPLWGMIQKERASEKRIKRQK